MPERSWTSPQTSAHRPWPPPAGPWALGMQWHDLLFAHWPLRPAALRPLIPAPLHLDTWEGMAWIGVVPFRMAGVRPNLGPLAIGGVGFPELNVRTYVALDGKPGVWFFSLDATNPLAVRGARFTFHLPYYDARMESVRDAAVVSYRSRRTHRQASPAEFVAHYGPTGAVAPAAPSSIDRWLTERYCLYAANRHGRVWRGEIDHAPWPLQPADAEIERNTMVAALRLTLPEVPPLLHFAARQDVVAWVPELARPGVQ